MGGNFKNLVFGGPKQKPSGKMSNLVFGTGAKAKRGPIGSLVFGGREKKDKKGLPALVLGDNKKPKRTGFFGLALGSGQSGRYEPKDVLEAESKREDRRLTDSDYGEKSVIYKRLKHYNAKKPVYGQTKSEGDRAYKHVKIDKGKLADIMGKVADEERFKGRTERSVAKQILEKRIKYKDDDGKLVELKFDRTTRRRLAKMAAVRDFAKPAEGEPPEVVAARIKAALASSRIHETGPGKKPGRQNARASLKGREPGRAKDIGAKSLENTGQQSGFALENRKTESRASVDSDKRGTASVEQGEEASDVAGDSGLGANKKPEESRENAAAKVSAGGSSQPVIIGGGRGIAAKTRPGEAATAADDDLFYSFDQVIKPSGNLMDFEKLVNEKKAADGYGEDQEEIKKAA